MIFGVDYYPEHWNRDEWESQAKLMQDGGFNTVRMGEFAWKLFEEKEGEFDFSFLDDAIEILAKYGSSTPEAMVESAEGHVKILEKYGFYDTVISIKSSDVKKTIQAYRLASEKFDYPLHLGVTEAGTYKNGIVKSAIGIGSLLADGIGDTIRVSLTDDPIREVDAAKTILKALGMNDGGIEVVSCPTCARCRINLIEIAKKVNEALEGRNEKIKVAVMGCAVNGPGEARDADIGIAGGDGFALLFKKGEIVGRIPEERVVETLIEEIDKMKGNE